MRRRRPQRRANVPLLVVFAVVVLGFAWAVWAGHVVLPFLEPERDTLPAGMIRVPASSRVIPAYTRVTRDDLIDPRTGALFTVAVAENAAEDVGVIRDLGRIIGRVTDSEKPAGYAFQEGNFVERGVREGLVAGIPPGMRGVTVEVDAISGLHKLRPGDRFDIAEAVAVETGDYDALSKRDSGALEQLVTRANATGLAKQAAVKIIVENGLVVTPVEARLTTDTTRGLTSTTTRRVPVEEVTIAVDAADVTRLLGALAIDAKVICLPRSGDPSASAETDHAIDHVPWSPFDDLMPGARRDSKSADDEAADDRPSGERGVRFVERVIGGETQLVPVPKSPSDDRP